MSILYNVNIKNIIMASINQIVSEITHSLGKNNDYALREHVRNLVIHIRNELIRRSMENHSYIDAGLQQRYRITLNSEDDYKITSSKVPRPVRFINNLPFLRVSGNNKEIPYVKDSSVKFMKDLPGMRGNLYYDYINDYIYVYKASNSTSCHNRLDHLENIVIEAVFEHPEEVYTDTGQYSYELDDNEWLIPEDMIGQLKELIFKRDLVNYRVNIADNDRSQATNSK